MPVTYTIHVDKGRVHTHCVGRVTLQEVIDHFRTLEQDPLCPAHLDVLLDLSGLDPSSIPQTPQVSRVVLEIEHIQDRVRFGACAILAPPGAGFGMMRMFEVMSDRHFRVIHSFLDRVEAELWLASQQFSNDTGGRDSQNQ
jgi:hypothetical protein